MVITSYWRRSPVILVLLILMYRIVRNFVFMHISIKGQQLLHQSSTLYKINYSKNPSNLQRLRYNIRHIDIFKTFNKKNNAQCFILQCFFIIFTSWGISFSISRYIYMYINWWKIFIFKKIILNSSNKLLKISHWSFCTQGCYISFLFRDIRNILSINEDEFRFYILQIERLSATSIFKVKCNLTVAKEMGFFFLISLNTKFKC